MQQLLGVLMSSNSERSKDGAALVWPAYCPMFLGQVNYYDLLIIWPFTQLKAVDQVSDQLNILGKSGVARLHGYSA